MSQWFSADDLLAAGLTSDAVVDRSVNFVGPPEHTQNVESAAEDAEASATSATAMRRIPSATNVDGRNPQAERRRRSSHHAGWGESTSFVVPIEDGVDSRVEKGVDSPTEEDNDSQTQEGVDSRTKSEQKQDSYWLTEADPVSVAREIVLRRLSIRAHSRAELVNILRKKNVPEEAAEEVLTRMEELRLIDDVQFAQDRVRSMQIFKGLGKRMMAQSLRDKGIDEDLIEHALSEVDAVTEYENAKIQAEKKLRTLQGESREVAYRRTAGFLARRGYTGSTVTTVLNELLADWGQSTDE